MDSYSSLASQLTHPLLRALSLRSAAAYHSATATAAAPTTTTRGLRQAQATTGCHCFFFFFFFFFCFFFFLPSCPLLCHSSSLVGVK